MADTGFTIPSQATVLARVKGDVNAELGSQAAFIRASLPWAMAHAESGAVRGLYLYLRWAANQTIPDRATGAELLRWIRIWLGSKVAATKATGTLSVTGILGANLPNGDGLSREDGELYVVTGGPYPFAVAGTQDVTCEAVDAGADGNYDYDAGPPITSLSLTSPPAGIVADCPLKTGVDIEGGADEETDEEAQIRMIERIQDAPQGGAEADYIAWAQASDPSVDRVWVQSFPDVAIGTVKVLFTLFADGAAVIPAGAILTTVANYISPLRPVTATVTVAAPTNRIITLGTLGNKFELYLLAGYVLADVKVAIIEAIEDMFRDEVPEDGADLAAGYTIRNSDLQVAISSVAGLDYYVLGDVDGLGASADLTILGDEYPTLVDANIVWGP